MMTCPYNHSHVFKREKFLKHLEQCTTKKNSSKRLYKCKFDSFVRFFKEERDEHYAKCPCGKKEMMHKDEDQNEAEIAHESLLLEDNTVSDAYEKSFHNQSIKTGDLPSPEEHPSESTIIQTDKSVLF